MLYTCVIDLKLTDDNQVKILEIQQSLQSGSQGYEQAYNQCIVSDVIEPFYQKTFGIPVFNSDSRANNKNHLMGASRLIYLTDWNIAEKDYKTASTIPEKIDFDKETTSSFSAIVSPMYHMESYSSHIKCEQKPHIEVVNDNPVFHAITSNKFLQNQFLSPLIEDLIPEEISVLKSTPKQMADKIRNAISSDKIVLKTPEAARAEGVTIVKRDELEEVLSFLSTHKEDTSKPRALSEEFNHKAWKRGEWARKKVIVAQSVEKSKPIKHTGDGKDYDPTMRVFLSLWKENGNIKCSVHGGYWKFPMNPISKSDNTQNIVSACPNKKNGETVSIFDMDIVKSQLEGKLPDIFKIIDKTTTTDIIQYYLNNPTTMKQIAVRRFIDLNQPHRCFTELNDNELKQFAELQAKNTINNNNFAKYNTKTKRVSLYHMPYVDKKGDFFHNSPEQRSIQKINRYYADYIEANKHKLSPNHTLYKPK